MTLMRHCQGRESAKGHASSSIVPKSNPTFSYLIKSYEFLKVTLELFTFDSSSAKCKEFGIRSEPCSNQALYRETSAFTFFDLV